MVLVGTKERGERNTLDPTGKFCRLKWERGIGLRDLGSFNLALLAKQGWKLVQNKDNMLARNLEAKYFPRSEFRETKLGNNASYIWSSMLEG